MADIDDTSDISYMARALPTTSLTTSGSAQQRTSQPVERTSQVMEGTSQITMGGMSSSGVSSLANDSASKMSFADTVETLCQKISWATGELKRSSSIEYCMQLCQLIKNSADALQSVKCASSSV